MRTLNFGSGPAVLPLSVLEQVQEEFTNLDGTGMSIVEMSHRSAKFAAIIDEAELSLRTLLQVPSNYQILFCQGGGTTQFASVPMNLMGASGRKKALYIVSGAWSEKAAEEAQIYGQVDILRTKSDEKVLPIDNNWSLSSNEYDYVYYCDNETVDGVEFDFIPQVPEDVVLVSDMSSNFMSRPVPVSRFGIIYAGAQKNIGPAGVTVVIIRDDLLDRSIPECPTLLRYSVMASSKSMKNTPPTFCIYVCMLVFRWMKERGGMKVFETENIEKSRILYEFLDSSNIFKPLVHSSARSRMNVCFDFCDESRAEELLKKVVQEAKAKNIQGIKGHRSVGGLRVALYNAQSIENCRILVDFLCSFEKSL